MTDGPTKAALEYEHKSGQLKKVSCMFNPNELTFVRTNKFETHDTGGGGDAPPNTFSGEQPGSFSVALIFDTTDLGSSVTVETGEIVDLMNIETFDGEERPPMVRFVWGTHINTFWWFVTKTSVSYTYFGADGMPLRAKVDVSFTQAQGVGNQWGKQNPTSGTPDPHGRHQLQNGETLDRVAARHYGDPNKWRLIAAANHIADPLALQPGRVLKIPKL